MQIALTIAGSDSGGGAGIQADLKTFQAHGVFGTSVIVALTAQNTLGVRAVHPVPPEMVQAQLDALAEDLPPAAVKSGMLANAPLVRLVADAVRAHGWRRYVCDPVMVSTSGDRLLSPEGEAALRDSLLPLAMVVTPNLDEAAILTGLAIEDPDAMARAGRRLVALGAQAALVKGGHLPGPDAIDLLVTPGETRRYTRRRLDTTSTHGTGCTLSAAITANLARGLGLEPAVTAALDYVYRAMESAPGLGRGHGPLNHGVETRH